MYSTRLFNPTNEEYAAIAAIYRAAWPDERQFPVESWRENDDEWPTTALNQRFVVKEGEHIMGMGACYEKYWQHQPGTVHIDFHIHPDHADQRVDQLLYDAILEFLRNQTPPPEIIATEAREDRPERLQFLQERHFQPTMRSPKASLRIANFDGRRFQGLRQKIAAEGIHIYTLSELYEREADWKQKLHKLRWIIIQDVPSVEPPTRPSLAEFEKMILDDPALNGDAWFIAVDETEEASPQAAPFVGMSNLWLNDPTHKRLDTGLTGVLRGYRRRGIATALKVCTIAFAQRLGAQTIETDNEENNPMFDLNLMLGFQPKAAWISYRKELP